MAVMHDSAVSAHEDASTAVNNVPVQQATTVVLANDVNDMNRIYM